MYDSAFTKIFITDEDYLQLSAREQDAVRARKVKLHTNRAAVKLKQKAFEDALWDCERSVALEAASVKANYRMGQAYMGMVGLMIQKEVLREYWDIDKAKVLANKAKVCCGVFFCNVVCVGALCQLTPHRIVSSSLRCDNTNLVG